MNDDHYSLLETLAYLHITESALATLVQEGKIREYRIDCIQSFKKEEICEYANPSTPTPIPIPYQSAPEESCSYDQDETCDVSKDYDWNCFLSIRNDIVAWFKKHIVIDNTSDLIIFLLCTVSGVLGVFLCWKILAAVWWLGKLSICIIMAIIGTVYMFKFWRYIVEDIRMHE